SANIFCHFWFPDHGYRAATLGKAFTSQLAWVLLDAFCPYRAAIDSLAGHSQHSSFCTDVRFRGYGKNGQALARSFCRTHVSRQLTRGKPWIPPGQLGHSVVAVRRGDVLSFLSFAQQTVLACYIVHSVACHFRFARPFRSNLPGARQPALEGIFLPGRHGRHRSRLSCRPCFDAISTFTRNSSRSCGCRRDSRHFYSLFCRAARKPGTGARRPRYDRSRSRYLHAYRRRSTNQLEKSARFPSPSTARPV